MFNKNKDSAILDDLIEKVSEWETAAKKNYENNAYDRYAAGQRQALTMVLNYIKELNEDV